MKKDKQLNREATIANIVAIAGNKIKNLETFKEQDDEFLIEAAFMWEAKVVYL
jgi:hypothetical protein